MRLPATDIAVYEGPAFEKIGEDGPYVATYFFIVAVVMGRGEMTLDRAFEGRYEAEAMATKVRAVASVDPIHWFQGSAWNGVREEIREADRLLGMGADEAYLERVGLA